MRVNAAVSAPFVVLAAAVLGPNWPKLPTAPALPRLLLLLGHSPRQRRQATRELLAVKQLSNRRAERLIMSGADVNGDQHGRQHPSGAPLANAVRRGRTGLIFRFAAAYASLSAEVMAACAPQEKPWSLREGFAAVLAAWPSTTVGRATLALELSRPTAWIQLAERQARVVQQHILPPGSACPEGGFFASPLLYATLASAYEPSVLPNFRKHGMHSHPTASALRLRVGRDADAVTRVVPPALLLLAMYVSSPAYNRRGGLNLLTEHPAFTIDGPHATTLFSRAVTWRNTHLVEVLAQRGVSADAVGDNGDRPLDVLLADWRLQDFSRPSEDMLLALMELGADPSRSHQCRMLVTGDEATRVRPGLSLAAVAQVIRMWNASPDPRDRRLQEAHRILGRLSSLG